LSTEQTAGPAMVRAFCCKGNLTDHRANTPNAETNIPNLTSRYTPNSATQAVGESKRER
jgi:hypothetical protein